MPDRHYRVGVYIAPSPLTQEQSYFEVEILDHGANKCIGEQLSVFWKPVSFCSMHRKNPFYNLKVNNVEQEKTTTTTMKQSKSTEV